MNISLAQFKPVLKDTQHNMEKMKEYMREAKKAKADIVLFPEMALTGYLLKEAVKEYAEEVDGPLIQSLKEICKEVNIAIIVSFPEKEGHLYYISCLYIDEKGEILGKYRKTHLFDTERHYFSKGKDYPVLNTKFGKVGMMICYDLEFPEVARMLRMQGADIIFIPTANMKPYEEYQNVYVRSRAMENEIPVVICNRLGQEGDLEFFGNSMVVDHKGSVLLNAEHQEGVFTCNVNLGSDKDPNLNYCQNVNKKLYSSFANFYKQSSLSN